MQPYQKSAEALRSGEEIPLQILKNAGLSAIGGGAFSAGSKALNKLIPAVGALISNYVPENLSSAGLNKLDPRFGKFIQGALQEGYSFDDLRNFIGEKVSKTQQAQSKENRNIIQQYDPELHTYIEQSIKNGKTPVEAGLKAKGHERFKKAIDKMVKDHKTTWTDIIESVFGGMDKAQPSQQQPALPQQSQQMQQQPQQQGQPGPGQQKLMQIMQMMMQKPGASQ